MGTIAILAKNKISFKKKQLELGMLRKGSGWLLATNTTHIPFQNSDTENGNKQPTQRTEARELFCIEQENPSFCCQFINNFVAVCEPFCCCCCCCCFRRRRRRLREPCFVH
jgi:hypothetical protein